MAVYKIWEISWAPLILRCSVLYFGDVFIDYIFLLSFSMDMLHLFCQHSVFLLFIVFIYLIFSIYLFNFLKFAGNAQILARVSVFVQLIPTPHFSPVLLSPPPSFPLLSLLPPLAPLPALSLPSLVFQAVFFFPCAFHSSLMLHWHLDVIF